jgi:hypothetical protein
MSRSCERALSILVVALCASAPSFGRDATEVLDNEAVVQMLVRGASESEILKAIEDAPRVSFDLEPDMIRELESAGVSRKVLGAMRRRQSEAGETPQPQTAAVPKGGLLIRFSGSPAKKAGQPVVFQVIRKIPKWAADQMGMLQRPEVEDLAFFLLCTRADHVPDHWQDRTELKEFTRHEKLLFRSGSHPGKSHGFEVMALDLPDSLSLEIAEGDHRLVAGVAAKTGADWHVVGSAELKKLAVSAGKTATLEVKLSGDVVGSHMTGFKEEQTVTLLEIPAAEGPP